MGRGLGLRRSFSTLPVLLFQGEVTIHYNKLQADPKQGMSLDIGKLGQSRDVQWALVCLYDNRPVVTWACSLTFLTEPIHRTREATSSGTSVGQPLSLPQPRYSPFNREGTPTLAGTSGPPAHPHFISFLLPGKLKV